MDRPFVVTLFGAESTGKTTLSKALAERLGGEWREEFARGYLETTGLDVTRASMRAIWQGQKALQQTPGAELIIQDTDLFSTVGYWRLPHVEQRIGTCPDQLIRDAARLKSDLYVIARSNIPFAPDVLRYGGDKRESLDSYWINLCESYELPYTVLNASNSNARITEASHSIMKRWLTCAV